MPQKVKCICCDRFHFFDPLLAWNELVDNFKWLMNQNYYSDHFFNVLKPYYGTMIRKLLKNQGYLIADSFIDCGNFKFSDRKVELLYHRLMKYELLYVETNYKVLQLLYLEKSKRYKFHEKYKRQVKKIYRLEAYIWAYAVRNLIQTIDLYNEIKSEKIIKRNIYRLNNIVSIYEGRLNCIVEKLQ